MAVMMLDLGRMCRDKVKPHSWCGSMTHGTSPPFSLPSSPLLPPSSPPPPTRVG